MASVLKKLQKATFTFLPFTRFYWKPHFMTVVTSVREVQFKICNLRMLDTLSFAITEPSFSNRFSLRFSFAWYTN